MAEIAVSLVIDHLIPWILEEVKLLKGVHKEVKGIKDELESIQSFLKDADARDAEAMAAGQGDMNDGSKTWLKQVREIAFHIEDVVDEYMLWVAQYRLQKGVVNFFHKPTRKFHMRHDIAAKIQDIKESVRDIKDRRERYGSDSMERGSSSSVTWHDPRVASLFIGEDEIVGIESDRKKLANLLVDGASERTVISMVGMGGLGKTTLARKVYDDEMVTRQFDCHAWIDVSQSYNMEEILRMMMKQFCQEKEEPAPVGIDTMMEKLLLRKLREYLQQRRYVVVFDDVWREDFWKAIKVALPDDHKGSRIIITTRSDDVASSCKESAFYHCYKLQPLPEREAWELFCKKAFQSDFGAGCPPELQELSVKIVRRCGGLPIAIAAIGGLLSTKGNDVSQWQKLHNSLGSELGSNPHLTSIPKILSLSYHELPYNLKCCFLYFGVFPEDYSISCMRLIRLWIAEGFVNKHKGGTTLEEVAEDYLTKLIQRNLVQVSSVDFDGKAKTCRVHDLMREVILSKLEELNFCKVVAEEDSSFDGQTRRISIQTSRGNVVERISNSPLRSVSLFQADRWPDTLMHTFFVNFKFLKVLDFQDAPLNFLPEEVGNLFHLRYLSVRRTKIKMLPKSIGQLHNLQTLDLKHSLVHQLPVEINKLRNLRHLLAKSLNYSGIDFEFLQGVKIQDGVIGCLEALQKLCLVEVNRGVGVITELRKLTQMRKLGIRNLTWEQGRPLCLSIETMHHLQSLTLHSISADQILDIHSISSPPPSLRRLYLQGRLTMLPNWIAGLQNLVRLRLNWSGLTYDPLRVLQALPKLLELGLYHGYDGEHLFFEEGTFRQLKVLRLSFLSRLNRVTICNGALPVLGQLTIRSCPQLLAAPYGIQNLRNVTLNFFDMPEEFEPLMYPFVPHIRAIIFNYRHEGGGYNTYTLH